MLSSDLCDYIDAYIVKGRIIVEGDMMLKQEIKNYFSKLILRLDYAYQKSITHL